MNPSGPSDPHPQPHRPTLDARGLPPAYPFKPAFEITPREASRLRDAGKILILDVRTRAEREVASIHGSLHIPLDEVEPRHDEVESGAGQTVATLCHHGVRSMRAALALRALGHGDVVSIAGGIDLWSLAADAGVPRYAREGGVCRVL